MKKSIKPEKWFLISNYFPEDFPPKLFVNYCKVKSQKSEWNLMKFWNSLKSIFQVQHFIIAIKNVEKFSSENTHNFSIFQLLRYMG